MIYSLGERKIQINGSNYFIAENAAVIGSVILENNTSIWFNTVIRADHATITIGENSNVQDSSVLHTDDDIDLTIGKGVTVGHSCVLHGCTIGDNCLIGINSVILNNAVIGSNCIIGANALITEGKKIPDNSLVMGSPGKIMRNVDAKQLNEIEDAARHYVENIKRYKSSLCK